MEDKLNIFFKFKVCFKDTANFAVGSAVNLDTWVGMHTHISKSLICSFPPCLTEESSVEQFIPHTVAGFVPSKWHTNLFKDTSVSGVDKRKPMHSWWRMYVCACVCVLGHCSLTQYLEKGNWQFSTWYIDAPCLEKELLFLFKHWKLC